MKSKRRTLRNFILAIAFLLFFITGALMLLTRPETIRYVISAATVKSPWKIQFDDITFKPLESRLVVSSLHLRNIKTEREISIGNINLTYKLWGFLKGKLLIEPLEINDVKFLIPHAETTREARPPIEITKLFFLQNVSIKNGILHHLDIVFPKNVELKADEIDFLLSPSWLGETRLALHVSDLSLSREDYQIAQADSVAIEAATRLPRWRRDFPYLNALSGKVVLENGRFEALTVEKIDAALSYIDNDISLDPLTLTVEERSLHGAVKANTSDQTFQASISIPKPITLPYIGKPLETIDTGGELSGSVTLQGKGFLPSESSGKAEGALVHRFRMSPAIPIEIQSKAAWDKGVITFSDGHVIAKSDSLKFDGSLDIKKKKMSFKAEGTGFPIELIFDKFQNPHIRPIFGKTDVKGTLEGWGKQFHATVQGKTHNGGYRPLVAEDVDTDLDATYDRLAFRWKVFQSGRQTGTADLEIKFGKKIPGQDRAKDINLQGHLDRHPLAATLAFAGLSGTGSGDITIKGPHRNFVGKADAEILEGKWFSVPFDKVSTSIDLTRKKLTFKNIILALQRVRQINFPQPLAMDILEGGIRLWGTPDPNLSIDIGYQYIPRRWQIKKIAFTDTGATSSHVDLSGSIVSGGAIDLQANGAIDLEVLKPLGFFVRDASGPVDFKLAAQGSATNPSINGRIQLNNCLISPRQFHLSMEQLQGNIIFEGHAVTFDNVTALVNDGRFNLKGKLLHSGLAISSADLALEGKDLRYRPEDGSYRLEFNSDVTLKGTFPEPLLQGDVTILDGKYTKDFDLLESITKPKAERKEKTKEISFSPQLNLRVRNTGDLFIRNNVGDIGLRADLQITGTRKTPKFGGTIQVAEGKVHYMGMEFDITRGFMEFRESSENPYLEVEAQREINVYNVTIVVRGNINNLAMDLSATSPSGPLEKRDVISLLAFGITETERQQAAQAGQQFGVTMAAQQLTRVVERPVTKFAHLDTFRLEAADPSKQAISRITVGKQVSDRISLDFTTDINTKDATQTVTAEYLITDNLLIKGSQSSNGRYEMDGAIRFRLR